MIIKKKFPAAFIFAIFGPAIIVVLNNFILDGQIQNKFYRLFSVPGSWLIGQARLVNIVKDGWLNADGLVRENLRLKEENTILKSALVDADILEKENQLLRRQLNVDLRQKRRLLLANIVATNRTTVSSVFIINKGSKDGIKEGLSVITAGNVLAGIVKQVFDDYSIVWMVDDPRLAMDVAISNTGILGRSRGLANGSFYVDLLTNTEEIETNAPIVKADFNDSNGALLIGQIYSIDDKSNNLFKSVKAKSFFEIASARSVFIVFGER